MRQVKEYWDKTWAERITDPRHAKLNGEKLDYICDQLWKRPEYSKLRKLDVGCGLGFHAIRIKNVYPHWIKDWTGIDLSSKAAEWASNNGLNVVQGNLLDVSLRTNGNGSGFGSKFELFIFLDVLEHFENLDAVANKVKELASQRFCIFGNVPLYRSEHTEEFERDMNIEVLHKFLTDCGCSEFRQNIYGIRGYPYMMFDAANHKGDL